MSHMSDAELKNAIARERKILASCGSEEAIKRVYARLNRLRVEEADRQNMVASLGFNR